MPDHRITGTTAQAIFDLLNELDDELNENLIDSLEAWTVSDRTHAMVLVKDALRNHTLRRKVLQLLREKKPDEAFELAMRYQPKLNASNGNGGR